MLKPQQINAINDLSTVGFRNLPQYFPAPPPEALAFAATAAFTLGRPLPGFP